MLSELDSRRAEAKDEKAEATNAPSAAEIPAETT
jgi:hypothetical protein